MFFLQHILAVGTMWCIKGETKKQENCDEFAVQFLKPELNLKRWQREKGEKREK